MKKNKTIGLALGSGGFRGFAHIGAIRSLEKNGIPISYLSGCSIGAWVAAYYSLFLDINKLEEDMTANPRENMLLLFDLSWNGGFVGGSKFAGFLEKNLQHKKFSDTKIPLKIITTDLISGMPYIFESGDVAQAVRASTSLPILFKPMEYKNKLLVDGGLINPVPGDLVRKMGADIVIGVNLYNKNEFIKQNFPITKVIIRSARIGLHSLAKMAMRDVDVAVEPDVSKYNEESSVSQYFTKDIANEIIRIGEKAMDKAIPQIKELLK
ncbi:MAG: patatin-like phospholipase family protein [Patescibacteria group bacterium]